jgi:hypothetical protein
MSDSLGNYEPKDLPSRTGPGEGGKRKFKYQNNLINYIILSFK